MFSIKKLTEQTQAYKLQILTWETPLIPHQKESDDWIVPLQAHILYEETNEKEIIGKIYFTWIQGSQGEKQGYDLWLTSSNHCADIEYAIVSLYNRHGGFQTEIKDQFNPPRLDILLINQLVIHPTHRGKNIGLFVVHRLLELYQASCGLACLIPAPIQVYKDKRDSKFGEHPEQNKQVAIEKIATYFSKLGFVPIYPNEFMGLSLGGELPIHL